MSTKDSLEFDQNRFHDEQSFMQWFYSWNYYVINSLVRVEGFSELLLKDGKGELEKPLTDDKKRLFTERVYLGSKWIKHYLHLFNTFLRFKESGRVRLIDWASVSVVSVVEQVVEELKVRKILSKATFNIQDELPFVRTTESILKDALLFLLAYESEIVAPDNSEFEVSFNFGKEDNSYIRLEIDTSLNLKHSDMNTLESVFEYPISGAAMGKLIIKALDGEFAASLRENRISYKILLPIWFLPDSFEKTVRVHLEDGAVELFLGQNLEIVKLTDLESSLPFPKWEILGGDQNIITDSSRGGGTDGMHVLGFTTLEAGTAVLKIGYAPSYSDQLTFYTLQVLVKAQSLDVV